MKLFHTLAATTLAVALIVPTAFAATTSNVPATDAHIAPMKAMKTMKKPMAKKTVKKTAKKSMKKKSMKKMAGKKSMKKMGGKKMSMKKMTMKKAK
jgi:hypothetical protein